MVKPNASNKTKIHYAMAQRLDNKSFLEIKATRKFFQDQTLFYGVDEEDIEVNMNSIS